MKSATRARRKLGRAKLSTTVALETYEFLRAMVHHGQARSLAEALDAVIEKVRKLENRKRLADATARYFDCLEPKAVVEENALAKDMMSGGSTIDFDQEI